MIDEIGRRVRAALRGAKPIGNDAQIAELRAQAEHLARTRAAVAELERTLMAGDILKARREILARGA